MSAAEIVRRLTGLRAIRRRVAAVAVNKVGGSE